MALWRRRSADDFSEETLYDPPWEAFVLPVFVVLGVAALATWIPTRRALRINPALLLKAN